MKIDWKRKLTSRKLWTSVASFVSMLLIFFGHAEGEATKVAALIMAGASIIGYVIGEGLADQGNAPGTKGRNKMNAALATVIVGVLSLLGTLAGSFGGIKLISYRIEQLEKRVEKHNNLIERTYKLEEEMKVQEEQIKVSNHRIDDLERETDNLREKIK